MNHEIIAAAYPAVGLICGVITECHREGLVFVCVLQLVYKSLGTIVHHNSLIPTTFFLQAVYSLGAERACGFNV